MVEGKLYEFTDLFLTLAINNKMRLWPNYIFTLQILGLFVQTILFPIQLAHIAHEQEFYPVFIFFHKFHLTVFLLKFRE